MLLKKRFDTMLLAASTVIEDVTVNVQAVLLVDTLDFLMGSARDELVLVRYVIEDLKDHHRETEEDKRLYQQVGSRSIR
jgi:hypothetical protein